MSISPVQIIENIRWTNKEQKEVWRHKAALELIRSEPVLDIGGGDGFFLSLLQKEKQWTELTLLDVSPVGVEKARKKGLNAQVSDITQPLPFADNSFSTICALDVLEHLYQPLPTLKEMARVANEIVIVVPNFNFIKDRIQVFSGKVPFQCKPQRVGHVYWFNYYILQNLIKESNLRIETILVSHFIRFGPVGKWFSNLNPNLFADSFAVRLIKS